ncbi:MAG: hypothetical protein QOH34_3781, partial [Mycobacterium sp.]|nr:hypothetical protein [Mycobacterium sp.]
LVSPRIPNDASTLGGRQRGGTVVMETSAAVALVNIGDASPLTVLVAMPSLTFERSKQLMPPAFPRRIRPCS